MNTYEMLIAIRGQLLEFDTNPISDLTILNNMNLAYTFMYSCAVRGNDTRFGKRITLMSVPGQTEYDLPKEAWGQRIEALVVPFPPTTKTNALGFHKIKRVDFKEMYKYDVPRIRVYTPEVWSVLNQTLFIQPKPIAPMEIEILISPQLIPLGITEGSILTYTANTMVLDTLYLTNLNDKLTPALNALVSVTDYWSGQVKALYNYNLITASTNTIHLANTARVTYKGMDVDQVTGSVPTTFQQDDVVTYGYSAGLSMFGTEYDQFIINQTVLKIRSSLNENDPEILNAMKENMAQLKGDLAGRPTGVHVERTFGRGASYTRPGRIS
jgi:hypothetical protein